MQPHFETEGTEWPAHEADFALTAFRFMEKYVELHQLSFQAWVKQDHDAEPVASEDEAFREVPETPVKRDDGSLILDRQQSGFVLRGIAIERDAVADELWANRRQLEGLLRLRSRIVGVSTAQKRAAAHQRVTDSATAHRGYEKLWKQTKRALDSAKKPKPPRFQI